jgi:hypothetical protein
MDLFNLEISEFLSGLFNKNDGTKQGTADATPELPIAPPVFMSPLKITSSSTSGAAVGFLDRVGSALRAAAAPSVAISTTAAITAAQGSVEVASKKLGLAKLQRVLDGREQRAALRGLAQWALLAEISTAALDGATARKL